MYTDKFIVLGSVLKAYPGGVGGTEVDLSNLIQSVTVHPKRNTVPTSAQGDLQAYQQKTDGQHEMTINLMHDKPLTVLLPFILAELAKDGDTPFQLQMKTGAAAPGNLWFTFNATVSDGGNLGGERASVMGAQVTWPISGPLSFNNGTTTTSL